jgi:hypothetical protein
VGAYPLVAGQRKAAELARALKAKVVVPMNNGDIDLGGSRLPLDVRTTDLCLYRDCNALLVFGVCVRGGATTYLPGLCGIWLRQLLPFPCTSLSCTTDPTHFNLSTQPTESLLPLFSHNAKLQQRMIKKGGTMAEFQRLLREVYPSALVKETPVGEPVTI